MKTFKWMTVFSAAAVLLVGGWNSSLIALGHGSPQVFEARFEVSQAVPAPAVSPDGALGAGVFFFDAENETLVFQVALTGLTSSVRALQFHNGPAGEVGRPIQTICGEGPAGVIGTPLVEGPCKAGVNHVMQARWVMSDDQVDALLAGNIYVNVHTETNFAPGEIRAQVVPVTQ